MLPSDLKHFSQGRTSEKETHTGIFAGIACLICAVILMGCGIGAVLFVFVECTLPAMGYLP